MSRRPNPAGRRRPRLEGRNEHPARPTSYPLNDERPPADSGASIPCGRTSDHVMPIPIGAAALLTNVKPSTVTWQVTGASDPTGNRLGAEFAAQLRLPDRHASFRAQEGLIDTGQRTKLALAPASPELGQAGRKTAPAAADIILLSLHLAAAEITPTVM
jgi:hypothetical protein